MDEFKLRSIEEFDSDFIAEIQAKAKAEADAAAAARAEAEAKAAAKDSLIPEFSKEDPDVEETPVQPSITPPAVSGQPLYVSDRMGEGVPESEEDFDYSKKKKKKDKALDEDSAGKKKTGGGALAGKIIAIVLLAATVVVFLLGCFVSVFLDNNGQELAGYTFSTLSTDIEKAGIHKGDLILAKKVDVSGYTSGAYVAVPASGGSGCLVVTVSSSYVSGDSAILTVNDLTGGYGNTVQYNSDDTLGVVESYIPSLGGLISFALENAILVCVLFVLLAALWCLILVLIEKSQTKVREEDEQYEEPEEISFDDLD